MDIELITTFACKAGISIGMYGPRTLKPNDNGTMSFRKDTTLTNYGEGLVRFAELIERHIKSEDEKQ